MNRNRIDCFFVRLTLAVAFIAGAAACSDEEPGICDDFAQPQIIPSERPVCLSFEPTVVGTSVNRDVLLQNLGAADLEITSVRLTDDPRGYFSFTGPDVNTVSCPNAAAVGVVYNPQATGWDTARLIVESNAENFETLEIFFLARAVPSDNLSFNPGPKPASAVGANPEDETCPLACSPGASGDAACEAELDGTFCQASTSDPSAGTCQLE